MSQRTDELDEWFDKKFRPVYQNKDKSEPARRLLHRYQPTDEILQKILEWVYESNRRRAKARERKEFYAEACNLYTFFHESRWEDEIKSSSDREGGGRSNTASDSIFTCSVCKFQKDSKERGWVIRAEKIYCTPCWAKTFEDGPTGFRVLREYYKKREPRRPGETGPQYINRIYGPRTKTCVGSDKPEVGGVDGVPGTLPEDDWQAG